MTKGHEFLVPKTKPVNLNQMVSKMLEPVAGFKNSQRVELNINTDRILSAQSAFSKMSTTGVTSFDKSTSCLRKSDLKRFHFKQAMRYIKKKLWEKGIDSANIYISYDTLVKISERLLQSESMGSDQNRADTNTVSSENNPKALNSALISWSSPTPRERPCQSVTNIECS